MTAVRNPAVSGQFYAGDETALGEQLDSLYRHELGPGEVPVACDGPPDFACFVAPHAGYPYSGPVAAHAFKAVAERGTPDVVCIIGPNHSGFGAAVAVTEADAWETPLGRIPVETTLRDRLVDTTSIVRADEQTHAGEHSIEVQVPFLQHLFGDSVPILPIAMTRQDEGVARDLADALQMVFDTYDGAPVVVASTDLTHYEPRAVAAETDNRIVDRIEALDVSGLYQLILEENVSMCGYGPTATGMTVGRELGAERGSLLKYATSGDTGGSTSEVVGYASMAIS